jgi:hypothetical protein
MTMPAPFDQVQTNSGLYNVYLSIGNLYKFHDGDVTNVQDWFAPFPRVYLQEDAPESARLAFQSFSKIMDGIWHARNETEYAMDVGGGMYWARGDFEDLDGLKNFANDECANGLEPQPEIHYFEATVFDEQCHLNVTVYIGKAKTFVLKPFTWMKDFDKFRDYLSPTGLTFPRNSTDSFYQYTGVQVIDHYWWEYNYYCESRAGESSLFIRQCRVINGRLSEV